MSAISTYLEYIRSKIYAKDVRTAIVNAISQCYDDVNAPALQTEAMQAAVQAKIDAGQMAALTIADGSLTGAKLANGTIPTAKIADGAITAGKLASGAVPTDATLTQANVPADAKVVGDKFSDNNTNIEGLLLEKNVVAITPQTFSHNGVDFVCDGEKITANGQATGGITIFRFCEFTPIVSGDYTLTGCPAGGNYNKYYLNIWGFIVSEHGADIGKGKVYSLEKGQTYEIVVVVYNNVVVDNIVFTPVLTCNEVDYLTQINKKLDIGHYDFETERGINLVSGSLQTATMGVAIYIGGIACTKKIPVNPDETIEIFVPKIDDDTVEYTYRFGQYLENGEYKSQIASTVSNILTIASDCYYFSFGVYAKKDGQDITYSFFEALKDKDPVAVIFTDRPKEDYASKTQVQSMIDKSISANTDIIHFNQNLKNILIQAKRPMNLSGNAYLSQTQPVVLLHFSDIHGDYVELSRMVEFKTEYADYLDDTICTGDIVELRWASHFNFWGDTEGADDILLAIGNHDVLTAPSPSWDWSQRATQQEQYDRYFAPFIANWGCQYTAGLTYYYKDYTEKKLRLIVLNCMLTDEDEAGQLTWFVNTLENARTNDLSVVVANHFPLPDPVKVDCNFTSIDKTYGNTDILPVKYLSAINDFITAGGKFVCHIAGHTHTDYVVKSTAYPNQIMIIVDALNRNQGNQYSDTQRTDGTRSQDLANVIVFDTSSKNIKIMRVGANMDHHLRAKNYITINYNTGAIITSN